MCILFGFNTFVLQQRLQAAHQDWGHVVLDTVQARVVTARRKHRANRGDRPGVRGGGAEHAADITYTGAGAGVCGQQRAERLRSPSSSSVGGRMCLSQGGVR